MLPQPVYAYLSAARNTKEVVEMLSKAGLENRAQDRPSEGNDVVYTGTSAHKELNYLIRSPHQGKA